MVIDLKKVAVHYAVSSVMEDFGDRTEIYSYTVDKEEYFRIAAGRTTLAIGTPKSSSRPASQAIPSGSASRFSTREGMLSTEGRYLGKRVFQSMRTEMTAAFERADFADVFRLMDHHFGMHNYSRSPAFSGTGSTRS